MEKTIKETTEKLKNGIITIGFEKIFVNSINKR
jgi:hypothetical protein